MLRVKRLATSVTIIGVLGALGLTLPMQRLTAQTGVDATAVQQTLDASVHALFTQTAQAGAATPNYTQTVEALFGAALTTTAQAAPPRQPAPLDLDALTVVETRAFDLYSGPARTSSYLAPSGERFAHFNDRQQICIYSVMDRSASPTCTALPRPFNYDPNSPRWSPDGRYLAFIDDQPLQYVRDSDIWLLDTQTGSLTNLTDDGAYLWDWLEPVPEGERAGVVDVAPRFSADSQNVWFVRYETQGGRLLGTLYSVSVDGDAPVARHVLVDDAREDGFVSVMDLAPDGQTLVFNQLRLGVGRDSVNLLNLATGETRRLYELDRDREGAVAALDFAPTGDAILVQNSTVLYPDILTRDDLTLWRVVTLDGRRQPGPVPPAPNSAVIGAGWSPDGAGLAYLVVADMPEHNGLYIGAPGQAGRLLLAATEDQRFLTPTSTFYDRLDWGANGVVLVAVRSGAPTIAVRLGTGQ